MTTRTFRGFDYTVKTETGSGKKIQGTQGNDWIEVTGSNNHISTGSGNDVILVGVEFLGIYDSPIYAGSVIDYKRLSGAAQPFGTTTINTGAGDDYVGVGNGNAFIDSGKAANYVIDLGSGNNIFDGGSTRGPSTIRVTAGNGNDILDVGGLGGDYTINAGGGNNWIYLASGNASVWAGSGNDVVTTNAIFFPDGSFSGGFAVVANYVSSPLDGGLGGKPYKQSIDAGNGDNQIALPVFGQTDIKTGSGNDFIVAASAARIFLEGTPPSTDVVNIFSGGGDDTVITTSTKSLIKTGSGNDTVFAGVGDDTIYTGSGNNLINLRGGGPGTLPALPHPLADVSFLQDLDTDPFFIVGGGKDTVYLHQGDDDDRDKGYGKSAQGRDTIVLGSSGGSFATIYGFSANDRLDVNGLGASFTRSGRNTLISAGGQQIGILQGYTGKVGLVA
jgi:Ca2+-binding RTX toxin-like protein